MKRILFLLTLLLCSVLTFSQAFVNPRSSSSITVQDYNQSVINNLYLPRLRDTVTTGLDTIGNLIYDRLRAKLWIRDTVLTGGHKWTQILKTGDITATTWGSITGTLSNQTDLQNALNLKFNISDTTNKWVQNVYTRNDSLFKYKNNTETFAGIINSLANNGLTKTGNIIQLGGSLIQSTPITVGTHDLSIVAANGITSTTRFTIDNTNTVISGRYEDFSSINTIYTNQDNIQIVSTQPNGARRILIDSTTGITIGENVSGIYTGIVIQKPTGKIQFNGFPGLSPSTDTTNIKPIGYNTTTGVLYPMANWVGSGGVLTADNGLTKTGDNIQLGGALIQPTTITSAAGANRIIYSGISAFGDGAQLDVSTTGSTGIAVRGQTVDGRGVLGVATTGVGVYGTATGSGGYGLFGLSTLGNAIYGRADSGVVWEGVMVPHSNNTIISARSTTRSSQAFGANGIGYSDDSYISTTTGSNRLSHQIIYKYSNATDASYTSSFEFWNANGGTLGRKMAIAGNGQTTFDQYTGTNFQTIDTSFNSLVVDASGNIFKRAGGGSGGITLANIGSGYRWVATTGGNIKTANPGYGILMDSSTVSNTITTKIDTTTLDVRYLKGNVFTLSQYGVPNDADLQIGSTNKGTNARHLIQNVLDKCNGNPCIIIWDTKSGVDSTLIVYPGTDIEGVKNGGVIAQDSMNCNIFMNANKSTGARNDSGFVIRNLVINGNGGHQTHHTSSNGWVCLYKFVGAKDITIDGCQLLVSRTFHSWFMNCENIKMTNNLINYGPGSNSTNYGNFDGVHINGPSRFITIKNLQALTNDDAWALNANDVWQNTDTAGICVPGGNINTYDPFATHGAITDVNIDGWEAMDGTRFGGRMLSSADSIDRVNVSNVKGTTELQSLIIDNWSDGCPAQAGAGHVGNIVLSDWNMEVKSSSFSYKDVYISLGCVISNLTIQNVFRGDFSGIGFPLINLDAHANIDRLMVDGINYGGATNNTVPVIKLSNGAIVNNLLVNNVALTNVPTFRDMAIVNINSGATVHNLQLSNINTDSVSYGVVENGTLDFINVTNCIYSHNNTGTAFLNVGAGITVNQYTLSNFKGIGQYVLGSGAAITTTAGDAFALYPTLQQVTTIGNTTTNDISTSASVIFTHSGTNRDSKMTNNAVTDNFPTLDIYPSTGTNVASSLRVIPKGTGYTGTIRGDLQIANTDIVADGANYEILLERANATEYDIWSISNGTGTNRPIKIFTGSASSPNTNQLSLNTDGTILMSNLAGTGTRYVTADATGKLSTSTIGNTLYTGDGTLAGNRTVTGSNNNLTFATIGNYRVNANTFVYSTNSGTFPYTAAILGADDHYEIGYTPTPGTFSKGSGVLIDTNNNASLGTTQMPSTAPLYATGGNTYVSGFENQAGNFYRIDSVTTDITAGLTQYYFRINAASNNITVTLPAASTAFAGTIGIVYIFKRLDNSANTVTIQASSGNLIDGASSFTLTTQYQVKTIQASSGTAWDIR